MLLNAMGFPDFLVNMSASADVLAQAKVEIDLKAIPEGKNVRMHHQILQLYPFPLPDSRCLNPGFADAEL